MYQPRIVLHIYFKSNKLQKYVNNKFLFGDKLKLISNNDWENLIFYCIYLYNTFLEEPSHHTWHYVKLTVLDMLYVLGRLHCDIALWY